MATDQRIAKWRKWVDGPIKSEVLTMHLHRKVWLETSAMLKDNAAALPESYWWQFMHDTYGVTQAVAVRRQADQHRSVASLGRLMSELQDDAARMTHDTWIAVQSPDDAFWQDAAEATWREQYAGSVGTHLDPNTVATDLERLTSAAAGVKHYVDKHVAHSEASAPEVTLTLGDLHDAIEAIGDSYKKYSALFTTVPYASVEPIVDPEWKRVFAVPWMKPLKRPRA